MESASSQTQSRAGAPDAGAYYEPPRPEPTPQDAWRDVGQTLGELRAYAVYLLTAKWDGIKVSMRNLAFYAALGTIGALAGAAIIITAGVLIVVGLAWALSALAVALFGAGWAWIGPLLVGLLVLGAIAAGVFMVINRLMHTSRERTVRKYEQLQREQHVEHGHSVSQRATQAAASA